MPLLELIHFLCRVGCLSNPYLARRVLRGRCSQHCAEYLEKTRELMLLLEDEVLLTQFDQQLPSNSRVRPVKELPTYPQLCRYTPYPARYSPIF